MMSDTKFNTHCFLRGSQSEESCVKMREAKTACSGEQERTQMQDL